MTLETVELAALAVLCGVLALIWRANARQLDETQALDDAHYGSRTRHPSTLGHVRRIDRPPLFDQDIEP